jgi:hypothetical protein
VEGEEADGVLLDEDLLLVDAGVELLDAAAEALVVGDQGLAGPLSRLLHERGHPRQSCLERLQKILKVNRHIRVLAFVTSNYSTSRPTIQIDPLYNLRFVSVLGS